MILRAHPFRLIALALLTLALCWTVVAVAAPKVVGIAAAVRNDVRIRPAAAANYKAAKVRQRVALADRVRTGVQSRLQLVLIDKTTFSVGPNAQLVIDEFVYDPDGGSLSASVAKGAFRFMSGKSRNAKKTVRTPSATIGIRGTVFDGLIGPGAIDIAMRELTERPDRVDETATLVVLRGPGEQRQADLPTGAVDVTGVSQTVTLDAPLLAAFVPYKGAEPIGPFTISMPGLARMNDAIIPPLTSPFPDASSEPLPFPDRTRRIPPTGAYFPPAGGIDGGGSNADGIGGIPGLDNARDILTPRRDMGQTGEQVERQPTGNNAVGPTTGMGTANSAPTTPAPQPSSQPTGTPTSVP